jgi:hypothetical protein
MGEASNGLSHRGGSQGSGSVHKLDQLRPTNNNSSSHGNGVSIPAASEMSHFSIEDEEDSDGLMVVGGSGGAGTSPSGRDNDENDDDDGEFACNGEERLPASSPPLPQQHKLNTVLLAVIVFYSVSGGPFGIEETVRSAGNFYTLLGFLIFPFVWSIPEGKYKRVSRRVDSSAPTTVFVFDFCCLLTLWCKIHQCVLHVRGLRAIPQGHTTASFSIFIYVRLLFFAFFR